MNLVILSGRLTKDVELSYTSTGVAKANITVAVNRDFTNGNGEKEADFIQCELWRKQAEFAANNLEKGNRVNLQGSWRTGSYENQQGQKVYTNTMNVTNIKPIDWANGNQQQGDENKSQQMPAQQHQQQSQQNSQYQGQQYQQTNNQQRQLYNQNDPFQQQGNAKFDEDDLPF